ncbi:MAG: Rossmann-like domain-containing protein [Sphaerochaetaceae bacterium]
MMQGEFYGRLKESFRQVLETYHLEQVPVLVTCRALSPEEAIGTTRRKDFPILTGQEVMLQAQVGNGRGQVFTSSPSMFEGTLDEILDIDLVSDASGRSLFIASMNAVMQDLGLCTDTVHCRSDGPENCAADMRGFLDSKYSDRQRIGLVGYQPSLLEMLSKSGRSVRVLDLNPANIGELRYGIRVEDGTSERDSLVSWADLILCTGSTVCNGSIVLYLDVPVDVLFFGISLSGTAALMNLPRVCFAERYENP